MRFRRSVTCRAAGSELLRWLRTAAAEANGGNLPNGQDSERPRRWKAERVVVRNWPGMKAGRLAILRNALTCVYPVRKTRHT
jgi:type VI secretion system protein ImpJ